ncbi:hypothetical protein [Roseibium sp.]|uniref:hypothetical protein n=1 Tax=Roseibium sp. TaxID=1936156 RepID=UPI003A9727E5
MFLTDLVPGFDKYASGFNGKATSLRAYPAGPANRWNLVPAWIVFADDTGTSMTLLQADLLAKGMAVADPTLANAPCAEVLLAAEQSARDGRLGQWEAQKVYSTRAPKMLIEKAGTHVLIEGRIVSLGKTARTRYLNFGHHWKSDLTAILSIGDEPAFVPALEKKGVSMDDLAGRAVRIRGYVEVRDGPLIRLSHPGQLEILDGRGK